MLPPSLLPIIPIIIIALISLYLIDKVIHIAPRQQGQLALDGLRGYMALCVFIHHSAVYYTFLTTGKWTFPAIRIIRQFGQISVFMFFMITAYLFFSKLLENRNYTMDWQKYYISRFLRIYPLLLFALTIILILVGIKTGWELHPPVSERIAELISWLFMDQASINGFSQTYRITAGVLWSLSYEWEFYCLLPFIGVLFLNIKTSLRVLLLSGLLFYVYYTFSEIKEIEFSLIISSPFLIGMLAAVLSRNKMVRNIAGKRFMSIVILPFIIIPYTYFGSPYSIIPYSCLSLVFIIIACGNNLLGFLITYPSRLLGQVSYSIYLLHGILLYITFNYCLDKQFISSHSPLLYWMAIMIVCIILMLLGSLCFKFIEKPCIELAPKLSAKLSQFWSTISIKRQALIFFLWVLIYHGS